MNKFASLVAITLLLSAPAWAEPASSADLTYCLDLKSDYEIAKCAGEVSPGPKGKPLSREQAEKILAKERASAPTSTTEASGVPATSGNVPSSGVPPAQD